MRSMASWRAVVATVGAVALLGGACGDSDEEATTDTTTAVVPEDEAAACEGTDVTVEGAEGDIDVVSSTAVAVVEGASYSVHLADFELDDRELVSGPEVPDDGMLATLAVTIFDPEVEPEPLEPGITLEWTTESDVPTFAFTLQEGDEVYNDNAGGEGTMTILAIDGRFCAEVDYSDDEKSVSGTVEAPVRSSAE